MATELLRLASDGLEITALGRESADLTRPLDCSEAILGSEADVVINAAAYTAVDKAEEEEALATTINGSTAGAMAAACAERGLPFLHISTDYVFDGSKRSPWAENDPVAPLGAYGRSKLTGEDAVRNAGGPHVILRTAWVFSAHGNNFVKTMLRVGEGRDRLTVVDDQHGGPTAAHDIAVALITVAQAFKDGRGVSGTYHFCGAPGTTWCSFAREIFARSSLAAAPQVAPITTDDWPTPAKRPENSVLNCAKLQKDYGIEQPDWRASLDTVLEELQA